MLQPRPRNQRPFLTFLLLLVLLPLILTACDAYDDTADSSASPSVVATHPTKPTAKPKPTATPTPKPRPGYGYWMAIGSGYTSTSDGMNITDPKDIFSSGDTFGFVAVYQPSFGTTRVGFTLLKVEDDGSTTTKLSITLTIDPTNSAIANQFPISTLMQDDPPGKYKLEITNDTSVLAWATFTYTG